MIREAKVEDWPSVIALGQRLVDQTPYSSIAIDRERALHTYANCMNSAIGFAWVVDNDGSIDGLMLGVVDRLWWSKSRYATDLVFYCEDGRSGLKLLREFVEWAWSIPGVSEVTCAQSSGISVDKSSVLYRRCGFHKVGELWTQAKKQEKSCTESAET